MIIHPGSAEDLSLALRLAASENKSVAACGSSSWLQTPADITVSTDGFDKITSMSDRDLTVSAGAGMKLSQLNCELDRYGVCIALDPPGGSRTLGSIIATGTSGPLADFFGPIRDQLLGLTFVTGSGRIVRVGGRVMKNVAGFDLTRLFCGSFGALGILTEVHLRLRPKAPVDQTLVVSVTAGESIEELHNSLQANAEVATLTTTANGANTTTTLAARFLGQEKAVQRQENALRKAIPLPWSPVASEEFWTQHSEAFTPDPVSLSIGAPASKHSLLFSSIADLLPQGMVIAARANVRWSGSVGSESLRNFRNAAGKMNLPVTIEKAPWETLQTTGIFGNIDHGARVVMDRLYARFDPRRTLAIGGTLVVD